jgi:hypothetical protein
MTYAALAILFVLVCAGLGARFGARAERTWVAASLALLIVAAQFALLMAR